MRIPLRTRRKLTAWTLKLRDLDRLLLALGAITALVLLVAVMLSS